MEINPYTVRGNRSHTIGSLSDLDGPPKDDDEAFAVAENVAAQWGESLTILKNDKPIGQVLPDRGF